LEQAESLIGTTVGNFRIVRMLGKGGMGTVYLGEHLIIGSRVAVKFLHAHLAADRGLVERFFAEAKAANLIGHENIVNIFDLNLLPPNRYYLVMEYLEGKPLTSMVGTPLDAPVFVPILSQICDALQAAHTAGVVHRDLKPENVFLVRRDSSDRFVKIVDFGIAKLGEVAAGITAAGLVVGTPEYMAPEQWVSSDIDGRADLYALGIIAYALATGALPFHESVPLAYYVAHREKIPEPPRRRNPDLPETVEKVILKALAKNADDRFQSAREFKAALEASLQRPVSSGVERPSAAPAVERPVPPPQPSPTRLTSALEAKVSWAGLSEPKRLATADLSRGGVFLCADPPLPPLKSAVKLVLLQSGGELACDAEVVRHVSQAQAKAWGMSPGFAVQFTGASPALRKAIDCILGGRPIEGASKLLALADDPAAETALRPYRKKMTSGHYTFLGLCADVEISEVRRRCRKEIEQLESIAQRPLSEPQRKQVSAALERVQAALASLGTPSKRAEYDAARSNFRGVARCLAAGLSVDEMRELQSGYLAKRPKNETGARLRLVAAQALLSSGNVSQALIEYEAALALDPLSLELHQKYWSLKRRLAQGDSAERTKT
jgi:serine/threonine-protein kinase